MNDAARIAVLEVEQRGMGASLRGLYDQAREHEKKDDDRFERQFLYQRGIKDEILENIGALEDRIIEKFADLNKAVSEKVEPLQGKVGVLWDEKNERKGALRLSNLAAHFVTSLISILIAVGVIKAKG